MSLELYASIQKARYTEVYKECYYANASVSKNQIYMHMLSHGGTKVWVKISHYDIHSCDSIIIIYPMCAN